MFRKKIIIVLFFGISLNSIKPFDWQLYIKQYPDLQRARINNWGKAYFHYICHGIKEGRTSVDPIENTNFDWLYYVSTNKLNIFNEKRALYHYKTYGAAKNFPYCKKFTFVILLHLYDLQQIDEFADKINHFMAINPLNDYYIKINVPLHTNIDRAPATETSQESSYETIRAQAPYHPELVTYDNYAKLGAITQLLKNKLEIEDNRLQIMFSENRGVDIGGFILLMDQVIKQDIKHDYIVKLHTKSQVLWRDLITSFLNIRINKLLNYYQAVYSFKLDFIFNASYADINARVNFENLSHLSQILNEFNLPKKDFSYSAGTMFIASSKMTEFFKEYNMINHFKRLNMNKNYKAVNGLIEHAFERFFGYIIDHLSLNVAVIDNYSRAYTPVTRDNI